ncbi:MULTISPECIES: hypothetical protein [Cyanophyceae]|uniref:hypothetical protein n=1 Tax=Cyanophyceae TaxID=3028117 RepID=UPI0016877735|nr:MULTISPECIES: hypothetical protein [Cyanophyceae]MBD1919482.1 hypothetical protein [Phormidium sp. FACHB-77]MBD2054334.1 hypothetical protein [Leptolyngbya sp. FACHB-60]
MHTSARGLIVAGFWIALVLELLHPGEHRFFLVHDGNRFLQITFAGSEAGGGGESE